MNQPKLYQRVTAFFTLWAFTLTSFTGFAPHAYADPRSLNPQASETQSGHDIFSVQLDPKMGLIAETFKGSQINPLILIQDAHAVPDAQRNIQKLIEYFQTEYGSNFVGLEGTDSKLDPSFFRSFPDQDLLKKKLEPYFDSGELSGSVAAAIFASDLKQGAWSKEHGGSNLQAPSALPHAYFVGLEDQSLYEQGLGYFLAALQKKDELSKWMDREKERVKGKKKEIYSPRLLKVDQTLESFAQDQTGLLDVLKILAEIKRPEKGSDLEAVLDQSTGPAFRQARHSPRENEGGQVQSTELEVKRIAKEVEQQLKHGVGSMAHGKTEPQAEFNFQLQAYQTSQISAEEFASFLKDLCKRNHFDISFSKILSHRANQQKKIHEIEGTEFFRHFESYTADVKKIIFRNEDEKKLDDENHHLGLFEKLIQLKLNREEWSEIKSLGTSLWRLGKFRPDPRDQTRLAIEDSIKYHLKFYENAEAREEAMFRNVRSMMKQKVQGTEYGVQSKTQYPVPSTPYPSVLVAGGFHTEGFTARCRKLGISYLLVRPAMNQIRDSSVYESHMRGEVSYQKYLKVEHGQVSPYKAFQRAVRDQLIGVKSTGYRVQGEGLTDIQHTVPSTLYPVLKVWRDRILSDLASEERIAEAGRYTKFIDELSLEPGAWSKENQDPMPHDPRPVLDLYPKWLIKVERFIAGLKKLDAGHQLTEQNILNILKPATIADAFNVNILAPEAHIGGGFVDVKKLSNTVAFVPGPKLNLEEFALNSERAEVRSQDAKPKIRILGKKQITGAVAKLAVSVLSKEKFAGEPAKGASKESDAVVPIWVTSSLGKLDLGRDLTGVIGVKKLEGSGTRYRVAFGPHHYFDTDSPEDLQKKLRELGIITEIYLAKSIKFFPGTSSERVVLWNQDATAYHLCQQIIAALKDLASRRIQTHGSAAQIDLPSFFLLTEGDGVASKEKPQEEARTSPSENLRAELRLDSGAKDKPKVRLPEVHNLSTLLSRTSKPGWVGYAHNQRPGDSIQLSTNGHQPPMMDLRSGGFKVSPETRARAEMRSDETLNMIEKFKTMSGLDEIIAEIEHSETTVDRILFILRAASTAVTLDYSVTEAQVRILVHRVKNIPSSDQRFRNRTLRDELEVIERLLKTMPSFSALLAGGVAAQERAITAEEGKIKNFARELVEAMPGITRLDVYLAFEYPNLSERQMSDAVRTLKDLSMKDKLTPAFLEKLKDEIDQLRLKKILDSGDEANNSLAGYLGFALLDFLLSEQGLSVEGAEPELHSGVANLRQFRHPNPGADPFPQSILQFARKYSAFIDFEDPNSDPSLGFVLNMAQTYLAVYFSLDDLRSEIREQTKTSLFSNSGLRAEKRKEDLKKWTQSVVKILGWSGIALSIAACAHYLDPVIFIRYVPAILKGWSLVVFVVIASKFANQPFKQFVLVMVPVMALSLLGFQQLGAKEVSRALISSLVMFTAIFVSNQWIYKSEGTSSRQVFQKALTWAATAGIIGRIYLYTVFVPFLFSEIQNPILRAGFDLGVASVLVHIPIIFSLGAVFGEKSNLWNDLTSRHPRYLLQSKTFRGIFHFTPVNFFYWFPILTLTYYFAEKNPWKFLMLHSMAAFIWVTYFERRVKALFTEDASSDRSEIRMNQRDQLAAIKRGERVTQIEPHQILPLLSAIQAEFPRAREASFTFIASVNFESLGGLGGEERIRLKEPKKFIERTVREHETEGFEIQRNYLTHTTMKGFIAVIRTAKHGVSSYVQQGFNLFSMKRYLQKVIELGESSDWSEVWPHFALVWSQEKNIFVIETCEPKSGVDSRAELRSKKGRVRRDRLAAQGAKVEKREPVPTMQSQQSGYRKWYLWSGIVALAALIFGAVFNAKRSTVSSPNALSITNAQRAHFFKPHPDFNNQYAIKKWPVDFVFSFTGHTSVEDGEFVAQGYREASPKKIISFGENSISYPEIVGDIQRHLQLMDQVSRQIEALKSNMREDVSSQRSQLERQLEAMRSYGLTVQDLNDLKSLTGENYDHEKVLRISRKFARLVHETYGSARQNGLRPEEIKGPFVRAVNAGLDRSDGLEILEEPSPEILAANIKTDIFLTHALTVLSEGKGLDAYYQALMQYFEANQESHWFRAFWYFEELVKRAGDSQVSGSSFQVNVGGAHHREFQGFIEALRGSGNAVQVRIKPVTESQTHISLEDELIANRLSSGRIHDGLNESEKEVGRKFAVEIFLSRESRFYQRLISVIRSDAYSDPKHYDAMKNILQRLTSEDQTLLFSDLTRLGKKMALVPDFGFVGDERTRVPIPKGLATSAFVLDWLFKHGKILAEERRFFSEVRVMDNGREILVVFLDRPEIDFSIPWPEGLPRQEIRNGAFLPRMASGMPLRSRSELHQNWFDFGTAPGVTLRSRSELRESMEERIANIQTGKRVEGIQPEELIPLLHALSTQATGFSSASFTFVSSMHFESLGGKDSKERFRFRERIGSYEMTLGEFEQHLRRLSSAFTRMESDSASINIQRTGDNGVARYLQSDLSFAELLMYLEFIMELSAIQEVVWPHFVIQWNRDKNIYFVENCEPKPTRVGHAETPIQLSSIYRNVYLSKTRIPVLIDERVAAMTVVDWQSRQSLLPKSILDQLSAPANAEQENSVLVLISEPDFKLLDRRSQISVMVRASLVAAANDLKEEDRLLLIQSMGTQDGVLHWLAEQGHIDFLVSSGSNVERTFQGLKSYLARAIPRKADAPRILQSVDEIEDRWKQSLEILRDALRPFLNRSEIRQTEPLKGVTILAGSSEDPDVRALLSTETLILARYSLAKILSKESSQKVLIRPLVTTEKAYQMWNAVGFSADQTPEEIRQNHISARRESLFKALRQNVTQIQIRGAQMIVTFSGGEAEILTLKQGVTSFSESFRNLQRFSTLSGEKRRVGMEALISAMLADKVSYEIKEAGFKISMRLGNQEGKRIFIHAMAETGGEELFGHDIASSILTEEEYQGIVTAQKTAKEKDERKIRESDRQAEHQVLRDQRLAADAVQHSLREAEAKQLAKKDRRIKIISRGLAALALAFVVYFMGWMVHEIIAQRKLSEQLKLDQAARAIAAQRASTNRPTISTVELPLVQAFVSASLESFAEKFGGDVSGYGPIIQQMAKYSKGGKGFQLEVFYQYQAVADFYESLRYLANYDPKTAAPEIQKLAVTFEEAIVRLSEKGILIKTFKEIDLKRALRKQILATTQQVLEMRAADLLANQKRGLQDVRDLVEDYTQYVARIYEDYPVELLQVIGTDGFPMPIWTAAEPKWRALVSNKAGTEKLSLTANQVEEANARTVLLEIYRRVLLPHPTLRPDPTAVESRNKTAGVNAEVLSGIQKTFQDAKEMTFTEIEKQTETLLPVLQGTAFQLNAVNQAGKGALEIQSAGQAQPKRISHVMLLGQFPDESLVVGYLDETSRQAKVIRIREFMEDLPLSSFILKYPDHISLLKIKTPEASGRNELRSWWNPASWVGGGKKKSDTEDPVEILFRDLGIEDGEQKRIREVIQNPEAYFAELVQKIRKEKVLRVMIVEDGEKWNADLTQAVHKAQIDYEGAALQIDVVSVTSAEEAGKRILGANPFHVVFLDNGLPGMSGTALLKKLSDAGGLIGKKAQGTFVISNSATKNALFGPLNLDSDKPSNMRDTKAKLEGALNYFTQPRSELRKIKVELNEETGRGQLRINRDVFPQLIQAIESNQVKKLPELEQRVVEILILILGREPALRLLAQVRDRVAGARQQLGMIVGSFLDGKNIPLFGLEDLGLQIAAPASHDLTSDSRGKSADGIVSVMGSEHLLPVDQQRIVYALDGKSPRELEGVSFIRKGRTITPREAQAFAPVEKRLRHAFQAVAQFPWEALDVPEYRAILSQVQNLIESNIGEGTGILTSAHVYAEPAWNVQAEDVFRMELSRTRFTQKVVFVIPEKSEYLPVIPEVDFIEGLLKIFLAPHFTYVRTQQLNLEEPISDPSTGRSVRIQSQTVRNLAQFLAAENLSAFQDGVLLQNQFREMYSQLVLEIQKLSLLLPESPEKLQMLSEFESEMSDMKQLSQDTRNPLGEVPNASLREAIREARRLFTKVEWLSVLRKKEALKTDLKVAADNAWQEVYALYEKLPPASQVGFSDWYEKARRAYEDWNAFTQRLLDNPEARDRDLDQVPARVQLLAPLSGLLNQLREADKKSSQPDYYQLLGISPNTKDPDAILDAYNLRKAEVIASGDPQSPGIITKLEELKTAVETISHKVRRQAYDESRSELRSELRITAFGQPLRSETRQKDNSYRNTRSFYVSTGQKQDSVWRQIRPRVWMISLLMLSASLLAPVIVKNNKNTTESATREVSLPRPDQKQEINSDGSQSGKESSAAQMFRSRQKSHQTRTFQTPTEEEIEKEKHPLKKEMLRNLLHIHQAISGESFYISGRSEEDRDPAQNWRDVLDAIKKGQRIGVAHYTNPDNQITSLDGLITVGGYEKPTDPVFLEEIEKLEEAVKNGQIADSGYLLDTLKILVERYSSPTREFLIQEEILRPIPHNASVTSPNRPYLPPDFNEAVSRMEVRSSNPDWKPGFMEVRHPKRLGKTKAVFMDWDGTIQESDAIVDEMEARLIARMVYKHPNRDQIADVKKYVNAGTLHEIYLEMKQSETYAGKMPSEFDFISSYRSAAAQFFQENDIPEIPGAFDFIRELSKKEEVRRYVVTMMEESAHKVRMKKAGLQNFFHNSYGDESKGFLPGKFSKAEVIRRIQKKHGLSADQMVVIENSASAIRSIKKEHPQVIIIAIASDPDKAQTFRDLDADIILHQHFPAALDLMKIIFKRPNRSEVRSTKLQAKDVQAVRVHPIENGGETTGLWVEINYQNQKTPQRVVRLEGDLTKSAWKFAGELRNAGLGFVQSQNGNGHVARLRVLETDFPLSSILTLDQLALFERALQQALNLSAPVKVEKPVLVHPLDGFSRSLQTLKLPDDQELLNRLRDAIAAKIRNDKFYALKQSRRLLSSVESVDLNGIMGALNEIAGYYLANGGSENGPLALIFQIACEANLVDPASQDWKRSEVRAHEIVSSTLLLQENQKLRKIIDENLLRLAELADNANMFTILADRLPGAIRESESILSLDEPTRVEDSLGAILDDMGIRPDQQSGLFELGADFWRDLAAGKDVRLGFRGGDSEGDHRGASDWLATIVDAIAFSDAERGIKRPDLLRQNLIEYIRSARRIERSELRSKHLGANWITFKMLIKLSFEMVLIDQKKLSQISARGSSVNLAELKRLQTSHATIRGLNEKGQEILSGIVPRLNAQDGPALIQELNQKYIVNFESWEQLLAILTVIWEIDFNSETSKRIDPSRFYAFLDQLSGYKREAFGQEDFSVVHDGKSYTIRISSGRYAEAAVYTASEGEMQIIPKKDLTRAFPMNSYQGAWIVNIEAREEGGSFERIGFIMANQLHEPNGFELRDSYIVMDSRWEGLGIMKKAHEHLKPILRQQGIYRWIRIINNDETLYAIGLKLEGLIPPDKQKIFNRGLRLYLAERNQAAVSRALIILLTKLGDQREKWFDQTFLETTVAGALSKAAGFSTQELNVAHFMDGSSSIILDCRSELRSSDKADLTIKQFLQSDLLLMRILDDESLEPDQFTTRQVLQTLFKNPIPSINTQQAGSLVTFLYQNGYLNVVGQVSGEKSYYYQVTLKGKKRNEKLKVMKRSPKRKYHSRVLTDVYCWKVFKGIMQARKIDPENFTREEFEAHYRMEIGVEMPLHAYTYKALEDFGWIRAKRNEHYQKQYRMKYDVIYEVTSEGRAFYQSRITTNQRRRKDEIDSRSEMRELAGTIESEIKLNQALSSNTARKIVELKRVQDLIEELESRVEQAFEKALEKGEMQNLSVRSALWLASKLLALVREEANKNPGATFAMVPSQNYGTAENAENIRVYAQTAGRLHDAVGKILVHGRLGANLQVEFKKAGFEPGHDLIAAANLKASKLLDENRVLPQIEMRNGVQLQNLPPSVLQIALDETSYQQGAEDYYTKSAAVMIQFALGVLSIQHLKPEDLRQGDLIRQKVLSRLSQFGIDEQTFQLQGNRVSITLNHLQKLLASEQMQELVRHSA